MKVRTWDNFLLVFSSSFADHNHFDQIKPIGVRRCGPSITKLERLKILPKNNFNFLLNKYSLVYVVSSANDYSSVLQALASESLAFVGLVQGTASKNRFVPSSWQVKCLLCDRETSFRERMRHRRNTW